MRFEWRMVAAFLGVACLASSQTAPQPPDRQWVRPGYYKELKPERWRERVTRMLNNDAANPASSQGVIFVGSATIAGWDLKHYFPQYRTLNRGIGGSLVAESTFYAGELIVPFKPSTIVFYSGDNDTAYRMPPEMIAADLSAFASHIHSALPKTQIVVLSIRPSIARLAVWDAVKTANEKFAAVAAKDDRMQFVDLTDMLLAPDGQPARDLLGPDLHHLNGDGFDLISNPVKRAIQQAEGRYWRGYRGPPGQ